MLFWRLVIISPDQTLFLSSLLVAPLRKLQEISFEVSVLGHGFMDAVKIQTTIVICHSINVAFP